jgi:hypothetical protein
MVGTAGIQMVVEGFERVVLENSQTVSVTVRVTVSTYEGVSAHGMITSTAVGMVRTEILPARGRYLRFNGTTALSTIMLSAYARFAIRSSTSTLTVGIPHIQILIDGFEVSCQPCRKVSRQHT